MQNYQITREEIFKLYTGTLKEVSAHSIGQWLKVITKDQFIVIPKQYIENNNLAIEQIKSAIEKLSYNYELVELENWL